jgi:hypothetical protein
MRRNIVFTLAFLAATTAPANGQTLLDACGDMPNPAALAPLGALADPVGDQFRFMCAQVANAYENVQPTIGVAFSGANPTLGTATTIGRRLGLFPRISATLRLNVALADVPDVSGYAASLSGATLDPMGTVSAPVGSIQGDLAIGLLNGVSVGPISGLGSVDLLASLSAIPAVEETGLEENILNFGAGARVGIIRQGLLMPGLSVSGMYRMMSEQSFGDMSAGGPAEFAADLSVMSARLIVSKGFLMVDLAAGAGYDIYTSNVAMDWQLSCATPECTLANGGSPIPLDGSVEGEVETAAWNVFVNGGLSLFILNVVAEVGYQKTTDVLGPADLQDVGLPDQDFTEDALEGGRLFGSVGLRITF